MNTASTIADRIHPNREPETDALSDLKSVAQKSQQMVEESIQRNPGLCVGAAIAAGVVLGCLIKRN